MDDEAYRFQDQALPRAFGPAIGEAVIRKSPDDFRVDEILGFAADGEGEHCLMLVEKREANTDWMAGQLARLAGVRPRDVGYAGLKDRHAVTRQWFTVPWPAQGNPLDWEVPQGRVIEAHRHRRKLRPGALTGNRFRLALRHVSADSGLLDQRLARIGSLGVPNYFGPQRFGRDGDNVIRLLTPPLPRRRKLRGLLLSAGRSWLFNAILAERVGDDSWHRILAGELPMLDGSNSHFVAEADDPALADRCRRGDIDPSGAMWGQGGSPAGASVAELEERIAALHPALVKVLEEAGMRQERRALRLPVRGLSWRQQDDCLWLDFRLPAGSYATTVIREFLNVQDGSKS